MSIQVKLLIKQIILLLLTLFCWLKQFLSHIWQNKINIKWSYDYYAQSNCVFDVYLRTTVLNILALDLFLLRKMVLVTCKNFQYLYFRQVFQRHELRQSLAKKNWSYSCFVGTKKNIDRSVPNCIYFQK